MRESFFRRLFRGSPGTAHYLFASVFLLRLIVLVRLAGSPSFLPNGGDTHFYDEWAKRIAAGEWTDHQAFYGLPLYAYWLAALYKLFGYSPFLAALLQAGVDAGTATLLFKLAQRVFGEQKRRGYVIGIGAAAGWALFIPAQAYSVILMPTAWLVFVVWFLVWRIVDANDAPGLSASFLYGLVIGITAMAVATILFFVPLLLAAIILRQVAGRPRAFGMKLAAATLLISGVVMGAAPCWLHNTLVAHDPVFLSTHSGVNFWIGNNPEASGYPHFPEGLRSQQAAMLIDSTSVAEKAAGRTLKRSEVSAFWSQKARAYIQSHPAGWLRLLATKVANFWNAFQYDDLGAVSRLRAEGVLLPGVRFGFVAALALGGACFAIVTFPRARWILAAILLQMAAVLPVFVTERYRLAAVPGLMIFAAAAAWDIGHSVAMRRVRRLAAHLAVLGVTTILVTVPRSDPALWAHEPYEAGRVALDQNDLRAAKDNLERAYGYTPQNAEVNFALGNLRLASGDRAAAQSFYARTLVLDAHHHRAISNLGVLALEAGDPRAAAGWFRAAAEVKPTEPKTHFLLAKSHFALAQYDEALREIELALSLASEQPEFLALREEIRNALRSSQHGQ